MGVEDAAEDRWWAVSGAEAWRPWAEMSPPERIRAIEALIARGCTSTVIANQLETTRNAICGCCARNGLTLPGVQVDGPVNLARPKNERSASGGHATRKKAGVTLAGPRGGREEVKRSGAGPDAGETAAEATCQAVTAGETAPHSPERAHEAAGTRPFPSVSRRVPEAEPGKQQRDTSVVTAGETAPFFAAEGVGFFDLKEQHCRRPLWGPVRPKLDELRYCGARAVVGTSYCRACTPRLTAPTPGLIRQRNRTYGTASGVAAS